MTDRDASPPTHLRARRTAKRSSSQEERDTTTTATSQRGDSSFDSTAATTTPIGAAAVATGFLNIPTSSPANPAADTTLSSLSSEDREPPLPLDVRRSRADKLADDDRRQSSRISGGLSGALPRPHKQTRSSGAFLLSDPIFDDAVVAPDERGAGGLAHRRFHNTGIEGHHRSKQGSHRSGEASQSTGSPSSGGLGLGIEQSGTPSSKSFEAKNLSETTMTRGDSFAGRPTSMGATPRPSAAAPLDLDSAQIVNMALNLSESRRLASRRNTSQPIPPRLAPVPDSNVGGSLRQHLNQQRRVSRTISPKPDRVTPRIGSASRVTSPLQPGFDPNPEGMFRYRFSQSTLARAQKAKDYLELLAQYRRVLEFVPPLKPGFLDRPAAGSPPGSPSGSVQAFRFPSNDPSSKLGRPYDPLQYIRNRKVRARERKVIDGEALGFDDVARVTEWVDEAGKWVESGQARAPGQPLLPPFAPAEEDQTQTSPTNAGSRSTGSVSKSKRPRVDWFINPADMMADVYWLEQGDNKRLVEDRHWRRVFPQDSGAYRPLSADDTALESTPGSIKEQIRNILSSESPSSEPKPTKHEHDRGASSTRDRTQHKLRILKGSHHHRGSSLRGRDLLRVHRTSLSDSSDEDSDAKKKNKDGSIDNTGKEILEKQMLEMLAREQRESSVHRTTDTGSSSAPLKKGLMTPERDVLRASVPPSRSHSHSRRDSRADTSEAESNRSRAKPLPSSPQRGRDSLEVPGFGRRSSNEWDTSQPNSPELRPVNNSGLVPGIGMDFSPPGSRQGSPSRHPLSKVKSIFRDRSRERGRDHSRDREHASTSEGLPNHKEETELLSPIISSNDKALEPPRSEEEKALPFERARSPLRKIITNGSDAGHKSDAGQKSDTGHKSQRSIGSVRLRGEDGGIGLRSLFRGPRIDSVLRSGVSKVSDMLWKKETEPGDFPSANMSSDESDLERARGRSRGPALHSRTPSRVGNRLPGQANGKSYLNVMPEFTHTPEHGNTTLAVPDSSPTSRSLSRRSSRFDMLKPPRIDVQSASPKSTNTPEFKRFLPDPDFSDVESRKSSYGGGVRAADARLNAILSMPQARQVSGSSSNFRHWSITGLEGPMPAPISKREAARLRALILSSGIRAMEIDRRARERKLLTSPKTTGAYRPHQADTSSPWAGVARLCPDATARRDLLTRPIAQIDLYRQAGHVLGTSIQAAGQDWQAAMDYFTTETAPRLHHRVDTLRHTLAGELSERTRRAADEADEVNRDLVSGQRLKVKRVVDVMEKMLRRKRRRFRWVRRATWLVIEWFVVGCMWWLWFVYLIWRSIAGVGRGVVGGVRWLLWL